MVISYNIHTLTNTHSFESYGFKGASLATTLFFKKVQSDTPIPSFQHNSDSVIPSGVYRHSSSRPYGGNLLSLMLRLSIDCLTQTFRKVRNIKNRNRKSDTGRSASPSSSVLIESCLQEDIFMSFCTCGWAEREERHQSRRCFREPTRERLERRMSNFESLHLWQMYVSGTLDLRILAHERWIQVLHWLHSIIARPANGFMQKHVTRSQESSSAKKKCEFKYIRLRSTFIKAKLQEETIVIVYLVL